jgi:hypothetical protein
VHFSLVLHGGGMRQERARVCSGHHFERWVRFVGKYKKCVRGVKSLFLECEGRFRSSWVRFVG